MARYASKIEDNSPQLAGKANNVGILISLLFGYYFVRFFITSVAAPILCVFLLFIFMWARRKYFRQSGAAYLYPAMGLLFSACLYCGLRLDRIAATYFAWELFAFWVRAIGPGVLRPAKLVTVRRVTMIYIVLVIPFLLIPGLQNYSTHVHSMGELQASRYVSEETHGLLAFFYHSGEFGMFSASLAAILLSTCLSTYGRVRVASLDSLLVLFLIAFVGISKSATGAAILAYGLAATLRPGLLMEIAPFAVWTLQLITQLYFASAVSSLIAHGSFAWRYQMASDVIKDTLPVAFNADLIDTLANWPHSVLMDFCLSFGYVGVFILYFSQLFFFFSKRGKYLRGWCSLFFMVGSVMPIGAGPVFLAIALACAYGAHINDAHRSRMASRGASAGAADPLYPISALKA